MAGISQKIEKIEAQLEIKLEDPKITQFEDKIIQLTNNMQTLMQEFKSLQKPAPLQ